MKKIKSPIVAADDVARADLLENADLLEVLQKYLPNHILRQLSLQTISQLCGGINDLIQREP